MEEDEGFLNDDEQVEEDDDQEESDFDEHFDMEVEDEADRPEPADYDDFQFEVLTPDDIVKRMVDTIKEVNTVVEVLDYNLISSVT